METMIKIKLREDIEISEYDISKDMRNANKNKTRIAFAKKVLNKNRKLLRGSLEKLLKNMTSDMIYIEWGL